MRKPSIECAQHEKIQDQEITLKFFFRDSLITPNMEIGAYQFTRNNVRYY